MTPEQLKDLAAAPWEAKTVNLDGHVVDGERLSGIRHMLLRKCCDEQGRRVTEMLATVRDAVTNEFIALARNAFDVMQRRGWSVKLINGSWTPCESTPAEYQFWQKPQFLKSICCDVRGWPDPFTALVEADRWYSEHVEPSESHRGDETKAKE